MIVVSSSVLQNFLKNLNNGISIGTCNPRHFHCAVLAVSGKGDNSEYYCNTVNNSNTGRKAIDPGTLVLVGLRCSEGMFTHDSSQFILCHYYARGVSMQYVQSHVAICFPPKGKD